MTRAKPPCPHPIGTRGVCPECFAESAAARAKAKPSPATDAIKWKARALIAEQRVKGFLLRQQESQASKPIKLLLSAATVRALYLTVEHVLYAEPEALDDDTFDRLQDVVEVLQVAVTDADETALIASVKAGGK